MCATLTGQTEHTREQYTYVVALAVGEARVLGLRERVVPVLVRVRVAVRGVARAGGHERRVGRLAEAVEIPHSVPGLPAGGGTAAPCVGAERVPKHVAPGTFVRARCPVHGAPARLLGLPARVDAAGRAGEELFLLDLGAAACVASESA